ncbi:hypothetical protein ACN28G_00350 [Micromonospora sp. WMMA1923]|uniref:hypothetical protein n=1 Tax=Micromonospora sp. WMMA1923 TaxID=3404125 RepID=UPI003B952D65
MTPHLITLLHNTESRFFPYEPGHALTQVFSHWRHLTAPTTAEQCADWAYHVCNSDLDRLETARTTPGGEVDFLVACAYRLLRLRSLSVGDVVAVTTDGHTTWLACEFTGWRHVDAPTGRTGRALTAEAVYRHLRVGHDG